MKNKLIFLLSILMVFTLVIGVSAESTLTFKGLKQGFAFEPGSEYSASDLFGNFKNVMPGDSLTETIVVRNKAKDCDYIRVFLRAVPHGGDNPLSDAAVAAGETAASMQDFLAQLSMTVKNGKETIFQASPDKLDGFAEPVMLGVILSGETIELDVTLDVPIDLGNEYANRVGEVDWVFLVEAFRFAPDDDEPEDDPVETGDESGVTPEEPDETKKPDSPTETEPPRDTDQPGETETPPEPEDPGAPEDDDTMDLTVDMRWYGDLEDHPDSIIVRLEKDGEVVDEVELSDDNDWTHTWTDLPKGHEWSVSTDPLSGYSIEYIVDGDTIIIVYTEIEEREPVDITVKIEWNDDGTGRPDSIDVALYNGDEIVEVVILGEWNDWTYTWTDLDPDGDWRVVANNLPSGYTAVYDINEGLVKIICTESLIQTGQLNWPIPVFAGLGCIFLIVGILLLRRKREEEENDNA